ncbi:MAG: hypothetical protein Q8L14_09505 [Myxococcales bacterium]|nr:hypothetical protein [Myxococcales bacterium]
MPVLQYTALLLETRSLPKLAASRVLFGQALEDAGLDEATVFQFVWHPCAPGLTLVTIFENGVLSGDGFELWDADLGKTLAKHLCVPTWELRLTGGTVFEQNVDAFDENGRKRWSSSFDGQLPARVATLDEDPFVPRAKARRTKEKALRSLGVGRIEADAGLDVAWFIELERAEPRDDAQAVSVTINDDWRVALAEWNAQRPRKAVPVPAPREELPVPVPCELLLLWKRKPSLDAAKLFLHDVAVAEKLDPRAFSWSVHRVGKSTALRCVLGTQPIERGAAALFENRITRLGELADVALVVNQDAPRFHVMSAVGYASPILNGSMEGRSLFGHPHLDSQVAEHGGCSMAALYEVATDPERVVPWLESDQVKVNIGGVPFTSKHWKALLELDSDEARERVVSRRGDVTFEAIERELLRASGWLRFVPSADPKQSGTLATASLEKTLGRAALKAQRAKWARATAERVRQGPMMSVVMSSF